MVTSELAPDQVRRSRRRDGGPLLVPGTLVVAYVLATGRWGAYLGWTSHSVYVTDAGLFATAAWLLLRRAGRITVSRADLWTLAPLLGFLAWAALRWIVSPGASRDVLRDVAPYVYAAIALGCLVHVRPAGRLRTLRLVQAALVLHAAWVTVSLWVVPPLVQWSPLLGEKVRFLEIRSDFDGALLSVLAGMGVRAALTRGRPWWARLDSAALTGWAMLLDLQLGNRAGLLALLFAVAVAVATQSRRLMSVKRSHLLVGLAVLIAAATVVVPQTALYERLNGDAQFSTNDANGTLQARRAAWEAVIRYEDNTPARLVAGVGFGPDFLLHSGARTYFGGAYQDVRAAHSSLINTYARVGLVGLLLFLGVLLQWARGAWRVVAGLARHDPGGSGVDELGLAAVLVSGTLLVSSLVGVILESPFGAIPFYWSAGLLLLVRRSATSPARVEPHRGR